jgi:ATP:corrinoid adenosyltransferase
MVAPFITIEQYGRPGWADADELDLDADRRMAKRGVEPVFTGRYAPREVIAEADLVTEMTPVKHYADRGVPARDGIER